MSDLAQRDMSTPRILTGFVVFGCLTTAFAQSPTPRFTSTSQMVEVSVNGVPVLNGVARDGTVQVSAKAFADAIGAKVKPGPDGKSVAVVKEARTFVASDRTSVSLRAIALAFGGTLAYNPGTRSANVSLAVPAANPSPPLAGAAATYAPDTMGGARPQTFNPNGSATVADPGFMGYLPWLIPALVIGTIASFYYVRRPSGDVIAADRKRNP